MDILEHDRQWADWHTRFKDAVRARGHEAVRYCLDLAEKATEDKSAWKVLAEHAVLQSGVASWGVDSISEEQWRKWAQDLYYVLESLTKGDATVTVRNSIRTNDKDSANIPQDGFRAWNAFQKAMNSKTPARRLQYFMEVIHVQEVKDKREINTAVNVWLRRVAKLRDEFGETL